MTLGTNELISRLHKQLDILNAHPDFNESCSIIDVMDAIAEITLLNEVVKSQNETIALMQNIIDSEKK